MAAGRESPNGPADSSPGEPAWPITSNRKREAIIQLSPEEDAFDGLVTAAVAPMLAEPLISEPQLSQVLLGHRVSVLRTQGRWLHCHSGDGYTGWIHRGYVLRARDEEIAMWESGSHGPLHLSLGCKVLDAGGLVMARLPWGARFSLEGAIASLPDGRKGTLAGRAVPVVSLPALYPPEGGAIVRTARTWSGAPYLWGGTTPWGVDCSGFVQAIFRLHGVELPRDSHQQAAFGTPVDPGDDLNHLCIGDLLFFAEQVGRISHVAISTGGTNIIHAALGSGGVHEHDLLAEDRYEREMRSLLVGVQRIIAEGSILLT